MVERKRITLDLGAHLYHCEVSYTSGKLLYSAALGIGLASDGKKVETSIQPETGKIT